jgi:hypothetical protein
LLTRYTQSPFLYALTAGLWCAVAAIALLVALAATLAATAEAA